MACIPPRTDRLAPWAAPGAPARMSRTSTSQELKINVMVVPPCPVLCGRCPAVAVSRNSRVATFVTVSAADARPSMAKRATHHAPRSITLHQRVRASLRSPGGGGGTPRRAEDMHTLRERRRPCGVVRQPNRPQSLRCTQTSISLTHSWRRSPSTLREKGRGGGPIVIGPDACRVGGVDRCP